MPDASPSTTPVQSASPAAVKPAAVAWWLRSKTLYGAAAALLAFLLSKAHGRPVTIETATDALEVLIAVGAFALTIYGRWDAQRKISGHVSLLATMADTVRALNASVASGLKREAELYHHETSNTGQAAAAAATVPSASGDSLNEAAPVPAGSGDEKAEYQRPVITGAPAIAPRGPNEPEDR